jgi:chorismate mutase
MAAAKSLSEIKELSVVRSASGFSFSQLFSLQEMAVKSSTADIRQMIVDFMAVGIKIQH